MLDMDDIQCREAREKSLHQAGVGTCSLAWQVGFFFDGIHRNINQDSDTHRLSNVSRLFRAYPIQESMDLDSSYLFSKLYIPGLGTPYEDQVADRLHSVMDSQLSALSDNSLDSSSSKAKEAAVDALYEANKKDWFDTLSHNLNDLFSIKTAKAVITDTAKSIGKQVTLEALPSLRDNPVVMEQFMTGVDARIDGAKQAFKKQYSAVKSKNQLPIKLIQVSVFGADLGGILARRFIDELLEEVCSKEGDAYSYEGVKIEITFAGLFDCSRRSSFDSGDTMADAFSLAGLLARPIAGPLEWIGGPKVIDFSKPLHPAVKKALHLVAANERRVYRPVVPLGPLKSEWRELLLPGISEDITGGLLPNEQRPSAELCRVALHEMYRVACKGEVPFPNFNTLQEIDPLVAAYFEMYDNLAGKSVRYYSRRYMQMAGNTTLSSKAFAQHLAIYVEWLGRQYADYKARLEKANAEERKWLKERWGWLEFVRDEARYVERAATNPNGYVAYAQRSNALKMAKTFLYPPLRAFPEEVAIFFTYFMHDFVSSTAFITSPSEHAKVSAQSESMISSHHFFLSRGIENTDVKNEEMFFGDVFSLGGDMTNFILAEQNIGVFSDTYHSAPRLNIFSHGQAVETTKPGQKTPIGSYLINNGKLLSAQQFVECAYKQGIDFSLYKHIRVLACHSGDTGDLSFASHLSKILNKPVKGFCGVVNVGRTVDPDVYYSTYRKEYVGNSDGFIKDVLSKIKVVKQNGGAFNYRPVYFGYSELT